jgi:hypothetical protein
MSNTVLRLPYIDDADRLAVKLQHALDLLAQAAPHFTERQRAILAGVKKLRILDGETYQATSARESGEVFFSAWAVRKNGLGGLMWLIAHEAYHLHDLQEDRREGNANLFAHRIKPAVEGAGIYTWKP